MFNNNIFKSLITFAIVLGLGACGKASAPISKTIVRTNKLTPKNPDAPTQPTKPTTPTAPATTVFEGMWMTNCFDKERDSAAFQGNLMTWTRTYYSDDNCSVPTKSTDVFESHFTVSSIKDDAVYAYSITYTDGTFEGLEEKAVITSNGLSFSDDNYVYVRVK